MPQLKDIKPIKKETYADRYKKTYGASPRSSKGAKKPETVKEKARSGFGRVVDLVKGFAGDNVGKALDSASRR